MPVVSVKPGDPAGAPVGSHDEGWTLARCAWRDGPFDIAVGFSDALRTCER